MKDMTSILIIYTGGTIGMVHQAETGALIPIDFSQISLHVPELKRFDYHIETIAFDPIIDSSEVSPSDWVKLAETIEKHYNDYDGFVILHGTDTMAYSASALSFMLMNLTKPIIFTGAQLPIGMLRTDGKENLITSIEIAAAKDKGKAIVPEVCIYFENKLMRGNRTTKYSSEHFNAFTSPNTPPLAVAGLQIRFNQSIIRCPEADKPFQIIKKFDTCVGILKLFPGITRSFVESILETPGLQGLILETYGSGNAPTSIWLSQGLKRFTTNGGIVLNVTQCQAGFVEMGLYETSRGLKAAGVISGHDITTEAALTKMMLLLGSLHDKNEIKEKLSISLRGEIS
jgi:L-asparaginase